MEKQATISVLNSLPFSLIKSCNAINKHGGLAEPLENAKITFSFSPLLKSPSRWKITLAEWWYHKMVISDQFAEGMLTCHEEEDTRANIS